MNTVTGHLGASQKSGEGDNCPSPLSISDYAPDGASIKEEPVILLFVYLITFPKRIKIYLVVLLVQVSFVIYGTEILIDKYQS